MAASCETWEGSTEPAELYFPELPTSCTNGTKKFNLPKANLNSKQTKALISNLYGDDTLKRHANISCINYYKNLQKVYNTHPLPIFKG